MFNGQPLPNIYLEMGDGSVMMRRASSFTDFASINYLTDILPSRDNEEGSVNASSMRSRYGFPCQPKAIGSCRTSLPISAKTSPPMPCRCASRQREPARTTLIARSASSQGLVHDHPARSRSIMDFRQRTHESCERFTTVLVVPTGIDADIGGHAGDAGPVARLLAAASDRLITHPNVVNGADINEMPENTLYVEGSVLTRLMMGTAGLAPVRANRVLPLIQEHPEAVIWHTLVNAVSAAYGAGGFPCLPVVPLACRSRDDAARLAGLGTRDGHDRGLRHALRVDREANGHLRGGCHLECRRRAGRRAARLLHRATKASIRSAGSRHC